MKIKLLTLFLTALMLVSVFVGCGGATVETEAPETEVPETNAPEVIAPETNAPETEAPETEAPAAEGIKLRVATANIGDFTGNKEPGAAPETVKATIDAMGVDLLATQEDVAMINGLDVKETLYSGFPYSERRGEKAFNYKAYLSKYELKNVEQVNYVVPEAQQEFITHPWFLHTYITVEGVDVHFINIHVEWNDKATRSAQFKYILEYIKTNNLEYCVVIGDFNPSHYVKGKNYEGVYTVYKADLRLFTPHGFKAANGGDFGEFDTILDGGSDNISVCDNILVSSNIKITGVERVAEEWMHDHAFLIADLEIMK